MNILIVFATNSGATDIASQIIADVLTAHGSTITRKEVKDTTPEELGNFDLVIFGSPSWDFDGKEGQPHEDYFPFMEKMKGKTYPDKHFAVFGLGDSSYAVFCGAATHLEELVKSVQGKLIIESIRIDGFFYKQDIHTEALKAWAEKLAATAA